MRIVLALIFLAAGMAAPDPAQSQGRTLGPDNAYGAALTAAMQSDPRNIDFAALRAAYVASETYTGRSALGDYHKDAFTATLLGETVPVWTETDINRALQADFPLAETHYAAFLHVKETAPQNTAQLTMYSLWYNGIMEVILASRRETPDGHPVFTVLSIEEESHVLADLGRQRAGAQALVMIEGIPHDRIETDQGPVLFDISAFFGR